MRPQSYLKSSALTCSAIAAAISANASSDYGPAIWNPPSGCTKYYTSGYGHKFHVCHDMEGYYLSSISLLRSCSSTVSVHYAVNGKQDTSTDAGAGEITQMILEADYAWHVCCWNKYCTGTEHEGFASNPAWYTEAMYQASSGISRHEAQKFGYATDRNHIVGHNEHLNAAWSSWASANFGINPSCNSHTDPGTYWDWSHYMALINQTSPSFPNIAYTAAGKNSDGREEIWAVGTDNYVYHNYQTTPNGGWTGWAQMGAPGTQSKGVLVGQNSDGRLDVFVIGSDGAVWHNVQVSAGGGWAGWGSLGGGGGNLSGVAGAANVDGRMEIFVVGSNHALWHNWQTAPSGGWAGWFSLGGSIKSETPGVGINADGHLEVFANGTDNGAWHIWQTSPGGGWTGWSSMGGGGGNLSGYTTARNNDGRLEVYVVGGNNEIWHNFETTPNGGWAGWGSFGGYGQTGQAPCANINSDGRLQIFANNSTSVPYSMWQNSPGGGWTAWSSMGGGGGNQSRIVTGKEADGRMEIFTIGGNNAIWHDTQNSPGGGWVGWSSLGGSLGSL